MAFYGSFLERLVGIGPSVGLDGSPAPRASDVDASIRYNVKAVFSTRQGSVATAPDYGLPPLDLIADEGPQALRRLEAEIAATLRRHEPRLDPQQIIVRVTTGDDEAGGPLVLSIAIRGMCVSEHLKTRSRFRALLGPEGDVRIAEAL